jgi:surface antigen
MRAMIVVAALSIGLAACQQPGPPATGPAPGGIGMSKPAGGPIGNPLGSGPGKAAPTAAGVAAGGILGSQIGKSLDQADLAEANRATQAALETGRSGRPLPWRNDQSGASGTVVPRNTYQAADGTRCREFQQTVTVGGETQQSYGTACKQQDGSWRIVQ